MTARGPAGRIRTTAPVRLRALVVAGVAAIALGCSSLPVLSGQPSPEEQAAYDAALESLGEDPTVAQQRLEDFLRRHPQSPLADDARVRLGELALARGDRDEALRHFDFVIRNHASSNSIDLARLRAGQILIARGETEAAERVLTRLRLSRLTREEQRAAYRALADSAADPLTRLVRLSRLRSFEDDPDALAFVDVEIDRELLVLGPDDYDRAAGRLDGEIPAGRVLLFAANVALGEDDLDGARRYLERAERLPFAEAYADQVPATRERLELRIAGAGPQGDPLPSYAELAAEPAPDTRGARGTLGVVLPLSGPLAEFGEHSLQGILLAAGVFEASSGEAVRVRVRDSRGRPELAAEAVRELASDDDVLAIVGPLVGEESEAAAVAAEQAQVPLVTLTSREEIAATRPQVLRLRTRPAEEVSALVDHAMQVLGAQTFAILYPRDAYGRRLRDLFWDAVEERGGAIVGVGRYDPEATDFADPIRRLVGYELLTGEEKKVLAQRKAMLRRARRLPDEQALALRAKARALTGPDGEPLPPIVDFDALFIPESHEKVVLIAPQLAFHEAVGTRLLGPSGWYDEDLVTIGRKHVEGAIFTAAFFPDSQLGFVQDFRDRYQSTYGAPPEAFSAQGYDAATLVLLQLAGGSDSRSEVRRGLLGTRGFPGVTGALSMRADGNARKRPFLLTVHRGRVVEVDALELGDGLSAR